MTAIPTSFSNVEDLIHILDKLTTQADAVLASVFVVQNVRKKYTKTTDPTKKSEYATILREHGIALETDLGIIMLNAELVTDERLEVWVGEALSIADRADRNGRLERLTLKLRNLEEAMSYLKDGIGKAEHEKY
ncbi:hypothetical protein DE146DRAFT_749858 [Phaeosphaeria sp. MPI-PUGE-AT-0046c]|nr:hypothetical protein DE146DRAFT_749858 [Phaeosphaeria sp. MPI-PUGE-AT-0046c]